MSNVTVWDTVFMMITVIPVSKMFSSIFMKMVARVGTVDQEKWAAIGLGALGATYGLMKKSGMLGGIPGGQAGVTGTGGGGGGTGGGGGCAGDGPLGGDPGTGVMSLGINNQGMGPSGHYSSELGMSGNAAANAFTGYGEPAGYKETPSGLIVPSGAYNEYSSYRAGESGNQTSSESSGSGTGVGEVHGGLNEKDAIPERGNRKLEDIIDIASRAGNKVAKGAAFAGMASSFAAPEVAPVVAGVFGASGKAVAGLSSTAYHIGQEIKDRKKNGQDFWGAMQGLTGTSNRIAATTKMAAALTMSPFGGRISSFGLQAPGRLRQWAKDRIG